MSRPTNTLSIVGMILGIIGIVLSIIPCTLLFGIILAIAGLILSIVGYKKAKDTDGPTVMGLIGIIASVLALLIGIGWGLLFAKGVSNLDLDEIKNKEYATCDEILDDMQKQSDALKDITSDGDEPGLGDMSTLINVAANMGIMRNKAQDLDCFQDSTFSATFRELERAAE